jgi:hypothetical protein
MAILFLLIAGSAFGASLLIDGEKNKEPDEYSLVRETSEGIKVEARGMVKYKGGSILTVIGSYFGAAYIVTANTDTVITIGDDLDIYDADGEKFACYKVTFGKAVDIDANSQKSREVIAGVPTPLIVWYESENKGYQLTPKYPRASFMINGEKMIFRDVPLN